MVYDVEWHDWFCYYESLYSGNTACPCFVCNTPSTRIYSISITLTTDSDSTTSGNIWFKIQGSIEGTTNNDDTWTDWFSHNKFDDSSVNPGDTVTFDVTLNNVGPPINIIILSQQDDNIIIDTVQVNGEGIRITNGLEIVYDYGMLYFCIVCYISAVFGLFEYLL